MSLCLRGQESPKDFFEVVAIPVAQLQRRGQWLEPTVCLRFWHDEDETAMLVHSDCMAAPLHAVERIGMGANVLDFHVSSFRSHRIHRQARSAIRHTVHPRPVHT